MNLKVFIKKRKKIIIIISLLLITIIITVLVYNMLNSQKQKEEITDSSKQEKVFKEESTNPNVIEITIEPENIVQQIEDIIKTQVGNADFTVLDFSLEKPSYNVIDKQITSRPNDSRQLIQPGMFTSPIKDAPSELQAIYFDGGTKRGGDEIEDEEGDTIPKYDYTTLINMHNGAKNIYIFKKRQQSIQTITVANYVEMIKDINLKHNLNLSVDIPSNYIASFNALNNNELDWKIRTPDVGILGVYIQGDNQILGQDNEYTLKEILQKTKYNHTIFVYKNE